MLLSIVLILGGLALMIVEVFVPGMIVGLIGAGMAIAGVVLAFQFDALFGAVSFLVVLAAVIGASLFAIRRLSLEREIRQEPSAPQPNLLGQKGLVVTDLKPSGYVLIRGMKVVASAITGYIEHGRPVKVIQVLGERVVVQEV